MYTFSKTKALKAERPIETGMPYAIQCTKSILIPSFSNIPAAIAFDGVPMMVAMPPVVAATVIPNNKALVNPDLPNELNKGISAATNIAVVAVFDMIMEATIAVSIKATRIFAGFFPEILKVSPRSFSSNFVFVMAVARKKPPNNNQMLLLEKVFTYLSIFSGAELKWGLPRAKTR